MKCRFGQICKLLEQDDSISTPSLGWLRDECLSRILPHMVFEIAHLIWQQEGIRHELVVEGKKALQSRNDNAEYILFGEVVHERVPVENAFRHLDDVQIVVSQRHAVPEEGAIPRLSRLPVPILANHVLHRVQLAAAMVRVYDDLRPANLVLLLSVHYVVLRHFLLDLLVGGLVRAGHRCGWNLALGLWRLDRARDLVLRTGHGLPTTC
jgi:hypothetical protein